MGTKRWAGGVLVALMPILLIACSEASENKMTASEAEAALCQDLTTLRAPIDQIKSLDPATATVGDVKALSAQFVNSVKSLDEAAAQVKDARVDSFESAVSNLEKELAGVSDDTTLQAASATAKNAADGVRSSWTEAVDGLGCK